MTARELYEYALIEVNKLEAPSLLLEDYNYFINKAVQQYINKVYNRYDINQQSTDDLKVLKSSTVLELNKTNIQSNLLGTTYITTLPGDYLHLLNCIVEYIPSANFKCYNANEAVHFAARRLSADMYSQILNNAYLRPMYKRPYYYINNWNSATDVITNPEMDNQIMLKTSDLDIQVDYYKKYSAYLTAKKAYEDNTDTSKETELKTTLDAAKEAFDSVNLSGTSGIDSVTDAGDRQSNITKISLEIRYGKDDKLFKASKVYVDYIKSPMFIRLTQSQIDETADNSQVLEFPDYVCFEIVNEFVKLLMENASDPRLQTNIPINQTIAVPQPESNK